MHVTHEISCGEPIPEGVQVVATEHFADGKLAKLLIQQVIDKLPRTAENLSATWAGHVSYRCESDTATVTARVNVWKESEAPNEMSFGVAV